MAPIKPLFIIVLLSINGVYCGRKGDKKPNDRENLLVPDSQGQSRPASGAPSLMSSDGSGKSIPAAQDPSSPGSSTMTQEQFQKLFGVSLDPVKAGDPMIMGSCAPWKAKILTAYNEVLAMVREGVDAVDELGLVGPGGNKDAEGKERYKALKGPFEAMFGIRDKTQQSDDLRQVKANYESILASHELKPAAKGPRWQIRCGDGFLQWKDAKDSYPETAKTGKLSKFTLERPGPGKPVFPNGAWYAPNMPPEHMLLAPSDDSPASSEPGSSKAKGKLKSIIKGSSSKSKGKICDQPGTYAVSFPKDGLLVLCQKILDIEKTPTSSGGPPLEWSLAAVNQNLHENTGFNEFMPTIAHVWLHHMFHYALQWTEGATTDARSPHVLSWPAAQEVAKKNQKQALKSPENYAVFAAAMYLSDWRWGVNGHVAGRIDTQAPAQGLVPPQAPVAGSSGSSSHSNPFEDPVEDPFQDPPSPGGSGSGSGSSGSGARHRAMRIFEA